MSVEELIKKNRPHLSTTSVRTYCSLIKNLAKKLDINLNNKHDIKTHLSKILEDMHNLNPRQRKTTLSALVVLMSDGTEDNDAINKIRSMMMKDIQTTKNEDREQKMTEKQKESWLDWSAIMKTYSEVEKSVAHLWKKDNLSKKEFLQLQDYVLLSCLVLIPPRRSLDYCAFKLRDINKAEDNYMDKKTFVFNKYKTASVYKKQVVDIPPKLKKIITDWSKKNTKPWLLLDTTLEQPLTPSKLTNRLYNLFDKKVSVNQLRHSYVSDVVLKDMPALEQLDKTAKEMGNSTETQITQYKKVKK
jgi:hypothetical protein